MTDAQRQLMSDAEQEVLKVLWDHGPVTVRDVVEYFAAAGQERTRSTVITLLQRLERKGYVDSDKSEHTFVFRAIVTRDQEVHARIQDLAGELCDGEALPLVMAFAQQHRFTPEEIARFRQLINEVSKRGGK
ncbi:MAG: blaI 2 [Schlesneria sp.]|nr:blaI 2 [Schlesneria sp.]